MNRFCFHDWSQWSDPIQVHDGEKQQWRYCKKCHKTINRTIVGKGLFPEYKSNIINVIEALRGINGNT